ncbi:MAG: ATP-binding protein [Candidatus Omnitrophota bacterium]
MRPHPEIHPSDDINEDVILSAIGEGSSEGISRIDSTGRILSWTAGAERILGYNREEAVGKTIDLFVPPEILAETYESIRRQINGEFGVINEETVRIRKSGERVPILLTRLPLTNPQGETVSLLAILKDISEEKKLQKQVETLQRNVAMAKVAAKVAHEIRTPLGVLFLKSDLLLERLCQAFGNWGKGDGSKYREPIQKCVSDIQKQISRLEEIANNYLHLSKTRTMEREQINLHTFIRDITQEFKEHYLEDHIAFECFVAESVPPAMLDSQQFQRVFVNLVRNSVEAIRTSDIKSGWVKLDVQHDDRHIEFTVMDNGPGMPEDIREAAFDPFTTSKSIGTGLGLYLVREIVVNHGGTIAIDASKGEGTTVRIKIPIQPEESK